MYNEDSIKLTIFKNCLIKNMDVKSKGMTYSKSQKKKIHQELYVQQNYTSKIKEKLKHFQINKN